MARKLQAYEVSVSASALRTIRVRARSGRDAMAIADGRISKTAGPWTIDFPGSADEHFSVTRVADGEIVGPGSDDSFSDSEGGDIDADQ